MCFTLRPTDLTGAAATDQKHVGFFPMFDELELSWTGGGTVVFAKTGQTYPNYVAVVDEYSRVDAQRPDVQPAGAALGSGRGQGRPGPQPGRRLRAWCSASTSSHWPASSRGR